MQGWKRHLLLIAIIAATPAAFAECPDTYEVLGDQGKAWLGMSAGGFIAGEGQSFHLECTCQVLSVEVEIILDGNTWYGVPPLGDGDTIYCEFRTIFGTTLAIESVLLDFDIGQAWLFFDFRIHNLDLPEGDYVFACYTGYAKQGRLAYHQADDIYVAGVRYISENGGAGPWLPAAPEHGDLAFKVHALGAVPNEAAQWGQVKTLYR